MKRPSFQFYPSDWLHSTDVRLCSPAARALWIDMICLMHTGTPYGYLRVNQQDIHMDNLAVILGVKQADILMLIHELEAHGVFSRDSNGSIYCRRMIRDEVERDKRSARGALGGNPNLKQVNHPVNPQVNLHQKMKTVGEEGVISGGAGGDRPEGQTCNPSVDDAIAYGQIHGIREDVCRRWWLHRDSTGWLTVGGTSITRWQSNLQAGKMNEKPGVNGHSSRLTPGQEADQRRAEKTAREMPEKLTPAEKLKSRIIEVT